MSAFIIFAILALSALCFFTCYLVLNAIFKARNQTNILLSSAVFVFVLAVLLSAFTFITESASGLPVKEITTHIMYVVIPAALALTVLLTLATRLGKTKDPLFTTKNLVRMAVFTALSLVLYLVAKFPLPFFPSFLDIQISDMPALLAGFTMGTGAGSVIIIVRALIKLPMTGTGGIGELADLIIGLVYVIISSQIYKRLRTKGGAAIALAVSSAAVVVVAVLLNKYVLIPFYTMYIMPWSVLIGIVEPLYPSVDKDSFYFYYLSFAVVPFNILRCLIVSAVTFLLYKPIKKIFKQKA